MTIEQTSLPPVDKGGEEEAPLATSVVAVAEPVKDPAFNPPQYVEIIAPMSLNEGYRLNVIKDGQELSILVPSGGVSEGQRFQGQIEGSNEYIPQGRWRDGPCDCLAHGCCHSMCCYTCFCSPLVLGQIMTRMSLNLLCQKGNPPLTSKTFFWITVIWVTYQVIENMLHFILRRALFTMYGTTEYDAENLENGAQVDPLIATMFAFLSFLGAIRFWWIVLTVMMTRMALRERHQIPGNCCSDFCCSCCCTSCTICQMARHTYDYRKYPVGCCTESCFCSNTGSSPDAPYIV